MAWRSLASIAAGSFSSLTIRNIRLLLGAVPGNDLGAGAVGLVDQPALQQHDLLADDPRPGHQHDESDIAAVLAGRQRRDQSAFAVTDEADAPGVDLLAGFQISDPGQDVAAEIEGGGQGGIAAGAADAAVIDAQHRDAAPGQVIGEDPEGLVAHHGLVAVLRTRTGDEERRPGMARPRRAGSACRPV